MLQIVGLTSCCLGRYTFLAQALLFCILLSVGLLDMQGVVNVGLPNRNKALLCSVVAASAGLTAAVGVYLAAWLVGVHACVAVARCMHSARDWWLGLSVDTSCGIMWQWHCSVRGPLPQGPADRGGLCGY